MAWHFSVFRSVARVPDRVLDRAVPRDAGRIITQRGLEVPMRIPKLFPVLVTGGLLLAAGLFAAAPGVSAQSFGYGKLTPAQKARVRPAVGGTRRQRHTDSNTGTKLTHHGDPARL
jgi:hypothetical protein